MQKNKTYIVKKDETLSHIAQSQLGKASLWPEILKANPWMEEQNRHNKTTDHVLIKIGEELVIPDLSTKTSEHEEHGKSLISKIKDAFLG